jgi:hypothetical protein
MQSDCHVSQGQCGVTFHGFNAQAVILEAKMLISQKEFNS